MYSRGIATIINGELAFNPDPPEPEFIKAGCGCEVYEGENIYIYDGKSLCPDCMAAIFDEMSLEEKAELLGCTWEKVKFEEG